MLHQFRSGCFAWRYGNRKTPPCTQGKTRRAGFALCFLTISLLGNISFAQVSNSGSLDVNQLIVRLRSNRQSVAHEAAQRLAETGAEARSAFPALIVAVRTRKDIRDVATYAVGRISESLGQRLSTAEANAALPALTEALDDRRNDVREVAAYAIGRLASTRSRH